MIGQRKKVKDSNGNYYYPITRAEAVFTDDKTPLSDDLKYFNGRTKQGYMNKIRVCSYNSLHLAEPIANIQAWLKNKQIHHMGLQETFSATQPLSDLQFLDFEAPDGSLLGWGTLMMSVFKPLNFTVYEIQTNPTPIDDRGKRALTKYETYINGKKVSIYNTHIVYDPTFVEDNLQRQKVLQILDADTNPYKILTGDFNVYATSNFDIFTKNYKICNGKDGVWLDTFKFDVSGTTHAIDNIIVSKNINILNVEVENELQNSDHRGLIADLELIDDVSDYNGKYLSILGDSISTYTGYIPAGNQNWYTGANCGVTSVEQTWWKRLLTQTGMNLLVNNSWSGSRVTTTHPTYGSAGAGCMTRCQSLHNGSVNPDVIIVYMGINDFEAPIAVGTYDGTTALPTDTTIFREAYAIMLNKILTTYPNAEVYVCTLPYSKVLTSTFPEKNGNSVLLANFNKIIIEMADLFGVGLLDFAKSGITYQNESVYLADHLHPNALGHKLLGNKAIKIISPISKYSTI